jgi:Fic family protein
MKPDITPADRGELVSLMEPLVLGEQYLRRGQIMDMALELAQKSAGLRRSLPASLTQTLADLVRSMNCYYSNLIEGHDTHPIDIERALKNDYSDDLRKRDLQLEAKAHITVQQWIDSGGLSGWQAITPAAVGEIHRRFCELLPDELLWVNDQATDERFRVIPGEIRARCAGRTACGNQPRSGRALS